MLKDNLIKLGFTQNQIKTYLALFELGQSKAGQLITKTKLHRNLVYTSLEDLEKRGLVTKILVNNVAQYNANDPESLISEIESKKSVAENAIKELSKIKKDEEREIQVLEGVEGIKRVRMQVADSIQSGENYFVLGVSGRATNPELERFWPKLNKMIDDKGGKVKVLVSGEDPDYLAKTLERDDRVDGKLMSLPIDSPMWFSIFRDVVNISIAGENPLTFKIKNQETAEVFKKYFDFFWNQDSYVLKGAKALQSVWLESLKSDELKLIGARGYFIDKYPELFEEVYQKAKKVKGLKWKNLVDESARDHKLNKMPWMEARFSLPSSENPNVVWLYGNKVIVSNWAEEEPIVFISENKNLVQSYNHYFESLWNQQVVVKKGVDAIKESFYEMLDELEPGEEYKVLGSINVSEDQKRAKFFEKYHEKRIKKGVKVKILGYTESVPLIKDRWKRVGDPDFRISQIKEYSAAPAIPMQIALYKNKVSIVIPSEGTSSVFKIENEEIAKGFENHFDYLWNQQTRTYVGWDQIETLFLGEIVDGLEKGEQTYVIGAGYGVTGKDKRVQDLFVKHNKMLSDKGVKKEALFYARHRKEIYDDIKKFNHVEQGQYKVKFLEDSFYSPMEIHIFRNKAIITIFSDNPTSTVYEDLQVVDGFKKQFDMLWGVAKF